MRWRIGARCGPRPAPSCVAAAARSPRGGNVEPRRAVSNTRAAWRGGTLFRVMTAKEKLLERAPHWSEDQAERALRAAEGEQAVDEWGDLSTLHEVSSAETMRRLAKEEQVAGHEPW